MTRALDLEDRFDRALKGKRMGAVGRITPRRDGQSASTSIAKVVGSLRTEANRWFGELPSRIAEAHGNAHTINYATDAAWQRLFALGCLCSEMEHATGLNLYSRNPFRALRNEIDMARKWVEEVQS